MDSAAEAVQAAVMAARLVMAIADVARRHRQRGRKGQEDGFASAEEAMGEVGEYVRRLLPSGVAVLLTGEAEWPQFAQQLLALRKAGVDLDQVLRRTGEIAQNLPAQASAKTREEATDDWVRVVRETLPAGPVREAVLASPAWSETAVRMARLEERGVSVRETLAAVRNEVLAVDRAVAKGLGVAAEPAASRDAQLSYGPLTTGLDLPLDLTLSDRERAFRQLAVSPQENERYTRWVREAMPGHEREAELLVASRQWPLVAHRMAQMETAGKPVREHLAHLANDMSWQKGAGARLGTRLVRAAADALSRPVGDTSTESWTTVNTTAARATSPSRASAGTKKATAPVEAGTATAYRQPAPGLTRGSLK
ncbi:hypothetical protein [Streptomyces sp. NPDC094437]|uniref:hypothetical protein n=1 Tax=Streptomyces sp. NPDC094437 TaxID=3366060 RepID=UPI003806FF0A